MWSFSNIPHCYTPLSTFPLAFYLLFLSFPFSYISIFIIPSTLSLPLCFHIYSSPLFTNTAELLSSASHPHTLQPISPQSPFQHLVFSLYHPWSSFHAGFLHGLTPSLCVFAVCVLFVSPTCHSETHCYVCGPTQTTHSAGCHKGQATEDYTSLIK